MDFFSDIAEFSRPRKVNPNTCIHREIWMSHYSFANQLTLHPTLSRPAKGHSIVCLRNHSFPQLGYSNATCDKSAQITLEVHVRVDSRFAPNQWETSLQSNAVSHWLGANLESVLHVYMHKPENIGPKWRSFLTLSHNCYRYVRMLFNTWGVKTTLCVLICSKCVTQMCWKHFP